MSTHICSLPWIGERHRIYRTIFIMTDLLSRNSSSSLSGMSIGGLRKVKVADWIWNSIPFYMHCACNACKKEGGSFNQAAVVTIFTFFLTVLLAYVHKGDKTPQGSDLIYYILKSFVTFCHSFIHSFVYSIKYVYLSLLSENQMT